MMGKRGIVTTALFAWLRAAADSAGVPFEKLIWAMRAEEGGKTGRLHFHVLLAGLPRLQSGKRNVRSWCWMMIHAWKRLCPYFAECEVGKDLLGESIRETLDVGARVEVVPFDSALPGVAYVLKAGQAWEMAKFGWSLDTVTLSRNIHAVLRRGVSCNVIDTDLGNRRCSSAGLKAAGGSASGAPVGR